jgi:hypothetical protein
MKEWNAKIRRRIIAFIVDFLMRLGGDGVQRAGVACFKS